MKKLLIALLALGSVPAFANSFLKINQDITLRPNITPNAFVHSIQPYENVDYFFTFTGDGIFQTAHSPDPTNNVKTFTIHIEMMNNGEKDYPDTLILKAGEYSIRCLGASFNGGLIGEETHPWESVTNDFTLDEEKTALQPLRKDGHVWETARSSLNFTSTNYNVVSADSSCGDVIKNNLKSIFNYNKYFEFVQK